MENGKKKKEEKKKQGKEQQKDKGFRIAFFIIPKNGF